MAISEEQLQEMVNVLSKLPKEIKLHNKKLAETTSRQDIISTFNQYVIDFFDLLIKIIDKVNEKANTKYGVGSRGAVCVGAGIRNHHDNDHDRG